MSHTPPFDDQIEQQSHQGNWMYMTHFPSDLNEALEWLLSSPRPSRNQNFDEYKDPHVKRARRLLKETQKMVDSLSLPPIEDPQKAPWKVEWLTSDWPTDLDKDTLSTLPPFKYQIHIAWTVQDLTEYELFLTPVHFRLITRLDEALSRRIGDELDGPTPT